jgi:hypothetical protein
VAADDLKRVMGSVFLRDIRQVEPDKKGYLCGDDLRIYEEKEGYTLRFLKGTTEKTRKQYREKFEQAQLKYKLGSDFTV